MTKVTITVLTFNRGSLLKDLINDLIKLTYSPLEIIIVDNHSEDDTQQLMRKEFSSIIYERTHKNLGVAARNIGIQKASGDIIITIDDDIRGLTDVHIVELLNLFKDRAMLGAVNFKVLDHVNYKICNWVHHRAHEEFSAQEFQTYEITEGAVAFRKAALKKTGNYPEAFFLSHEGPDLAFRLLDHGFDVIYSPKIEVIHFHSQLGRKSWFRYYYDSRNQLWLAARNLPASYAIIYLSRGLISMLVYSIRDGFFRYWLKGVVDGLRGMGAALTQRRVLKLKTLQRIKALDKSRPSLAYMIRTRLAKKEVRL